MVQDRVVKDPLTSVTPSSRILLAHGSGGRLSQELLEKLILPTLQGPGPHTMEDAAVLPSPSRLAFTTDSFVVNPILFPGGTIGDLAVNGTVNDLAMMGAKPLYITVGLILEEGLELDPLEAVIAAVAARAREAAVRVVAGDTKVVDRGKADKVFINTAGVGEVGEGSLSASALRAGDRIIISGTIGDHGMAVMSKREGLAFSSPILSDTAPLNGLVEAMQTADAEIHALRDPTRGGLATTLNELAQASGVGIEVDEGSVPVADEVCRACELLGLDPLYVANEGKLVASVAPEAADRVLEAMRAHRYGRDAAVIGEVTADHSGTVLLRTTIGGRRILDMLTGEHLPRIC